MGSTDTTPALLLLPDAVVTLRELEAAIRAITRDVAVLREGVDLLVHDVRREMDALREGVDLLVHDVRRDIQDLRETMNREDGTTKAITVSYAMSLAELRHMLDALCAMGVSNKNRV